MGRAPLGVLRQANSDVRGTTWGSIDRPQGDSQVFGQCRIGVSIGRKADVIHERCPGDTFDLGKIQIKLQAIVSRLDCRWLADESGVFWFFLDFVIPLGCKRVACQVGTWADVDRQEGLDGTASNTRHFNVDLDPVDLVLVVDGRHLIEVEWLMASTGEVRVEQRVQTERVFRTG